MAKIHDVAYCLNCKKFFHENLTDGSGFICCPVCKDAYKFNVIQLSFNENERYCIQEQDDFVIQFHNKKQFNKLINIFNKLMELSKDTKKEKEYFDNLNS